MSQQELGNLFQEPFWSLCGLNFSWALLSLLLDGALHTKADGEELPGVTLTPDQSFTHINAALWSPLELQHTHSSLTHTRTHLLG